MNECMYALLGQVQRGREAVKRENVEGHGSGIDRVHLVFQRHPRASIFVSGQNCYFPVSHYILPTAIVYCTCNCG